MEFSKEVKRLGFGLVAVGLALGATACSREVNGHGSVGAREFMAPQTFDHIKWVVDEHGLGTLTKEDDSKNLTMTASNISCTLDGGANMNVVLDFTTERGHGSYSRELSLTPADIVRDGLCVDGRISPTVTTGGLSGLADKVEAQVK